MWMGNLGILYKVRKKQGKGLLSSGLFDILIIKKEVLMLYQICLQSLNVFYDEAFLYH